MPALEALEDAQAWIAMARECKTLEEVLSKLSRIEECVVMAQEAGL